jgi:hypothetical protein
VLRDVTGLAVLGAVSMIADPDRARNQRRGKIAFLVGWEPWWVCLAQ